MQDVRSKGSVLGIDCLSKNIRTKEIIQEKVDDFVLELEEVLTLSELKDFKSEILLDFENTAREAQADLFKHCQTQEELREEMRLREEREEKQLEEEMRLREERKTKKQSKEERIRKYNPKTKTIIQQW
jgi:hypothetical protein